MVRKAWTDVRTERLARPETQAGYDLARSSYEFGQRVRERRTEAGMTQKDLSLRSPTTRYRCRGASCGHAGLAVG